MSKLKISQCMIVKNEEKNIEKALSWGRAYMHEQIVVDTGSTDRTVELAKAMGAKVYYFDWVDDFSAAKNYAIEQTSGDWIAFLDADEYLTEEWAKKLPALLEKSDRDGYDAVSTLIISINKAGEPISVSKNPRFFRHLPELRYRNPIHEILFYQDHALTNRQVMDTGDEFPIYHTGYDPQIMEEKKTSERNGRLLKRELEKDPDNYHIMGYLGDCYNGGVGHNTEGERYYRMALEKMPQSLNVGDERSAATLVRLLAIVADRKDDREFFVLYKEMTRRAVWVYDFDYMAGVVYIRNQEYEKAVVCFEKALQISDQHGTSAYGVYMNQNIAGMWEMLARCYYETKNLSACVRTCVSLLKVDKERLDALMLLLLALKEEAPEEVLHFLSNIYDIHQTAERIFLLRAAVGAGTKGVLELLKKECTPEELVYLDAGKRVHDEEG